MSNDITKGQSVIIGPDEGRSLWQPLPSRGYVDVNLTPDNMVYETFSSGVQVMPPGCTVGEHGHKQNHELIFVYEGTGEVKIDGKLSEFGPGTTILFGRNCSHWIKNTGETDLKMFWVFFPPGLEELFYAIGKDRKPGDPMPAPFERPDNVEEIKDKLHFMSPGSTD